MGHHPAPQCISAPHLKLPGGICFRMAPEKRIVYSTGNAKGTARILNMWFGCVRACYSCSFVFVWGWGRHAETNLFDSKRKLFAFRPQTPAKKTKTNTHTHTQCQNRNNKSTTCLYEWGRCVAKNQPWQLHWVTHMLKNETSSDKYRDHAMPKQRLCPVPFIRPTCTKAAAHRNKEPNAPRASPTCQTPPVKTASAVTTHIHLLSLVVVYSNFVQLLIGSNVFDSNVKNHPKT